ncbi:hypothetical protein GCM10027084_04600 [Pseudoxanthomonas sangjuensis]|uniref:nuclear transport factor 2 family protein n=1 Tax=Pseudoxanthomonas sangjuensis TaxID=1503750 RepID=UPI0013910A5F|nr:nuclear transport factor 2 family protein [Pseudoxanthomonas sangjuensis]KAF1707254.1 hypothetical protein CSC71_13230 [Pseudoxanthomonas sangjuensis]
MVIQLDSPLSAEQRVAIVDALYRFGAGQDLKDRGLFESAFAPDAVLDFTQPTRDVGGRETSPMLGRNAIVGTVFGNLEDLDTTHTVANPRVIAYDGRHAALWALVEAQHLPRDDHRRHLLLKNVYEVRLSQRQDLWRIEHLRIRNVWWDGDPAVLFPRRASAVHAPANRIPEPSDA